LRRQASLQGGGGTTVIGVGVARRGVTIIGTERSWNVVGGSVKRFGEEYIAHRDSAQNYQQWF
jgi:hypothetical protein